MKFICASPHMGEPCFFGNCWSNRTTDMRKNMPPKQVFWLSFNRYGSFWGKNFKTVFGTPFPVEKVVFIFVIFWKIVMPQNINFRSYTYWNFFFFFFFFEKSCYMENMQNLISFIKKFILIFVTRHPFLSKWNSPPTNGFSQFFNINWRTSVRFSCSKVYSFERKFYGE